MKIVVLYSGGMDSLILRALAQQQQGAEVVSVWWDHGQAPMAQECAALPDDVLRRHVDWLGRAGAMVLDPTTPVVAGRFRPGETSPAFLPGRNLVFATLAGCQFLPDEIWLGALASEVHAGATDKNHRFMADTGALLSYVVSPFKEGAIRVRAPLAERGWDKFAAARWGLQHGGLTLAALKRSWSCMGSWASIFDRALPCGNCQACLRRRALFAGLGDHEPEPTARPLLLPGPARDWLIASALALPATRDDLGAYMAFLAPWLREAHGGDPEMLRVADALEQHLVPVYPEHGEPT